MKILIDTCVIIDALQARKPFNEDAEKVILAVAQNKCEGYITAKSVTDIYYLIHRCTHSDSETRNIISKVLMIINILDTTGIDIKKAMLSEMSDYEDAVMVETAVRENVDLIVTRYIKDFVKSKVKVKTPKEFIDNIH